MRLQFNAPCVNWTVNISSCIACNRCVHSYYSFAVKKFVKDVLCVCVCLCEPLPSLEVFHEVVAITLGSWGNSDPVNKRKWRRLLACFVAVGLYHFQLLFH